MRLLRHMAELLYDIMCQITVKSHLELEEREKAIHQKQEKQGPDMSTNKMTTSIDF